MDVNAIRQSAENKNTWAQSLQLSHKGADEILPIWGAMTSANNVYYTSVVEVSIPQLIE